MRDTNEKREPNVEIEYDVISKQYTAKSYDEYGIVVGYGNSLCEALSDYDNALRTQIIKHERSA